MENRLELFRERIAAFDGAADPTRALAQGYMIEEPDQHDATNTLFKRISLRPKSKNLLVGGIGSGKTTQLLRLCQLFQEAPDIGIYPHYIDVTTYAISNDVQVGTLDAIIGLELIDLLEKKGFQLDETRRKAVQQFAYGSSNIQLLPSLNLLKVPGVLSSHSRSLDLSNQLAQVLYSLIKDFQVRFQQTPYFFIDGLDRIDEAEKFTRIASPHLQTSEIGYLIIGSASLLYSSFVGSIDSIFNHIEYRSAFDVTSNNKAYTFFKRVLVVRSDEDFFHRAALQDLIVFSGGVLRDLINLSQEAIQEAYLADAEIVEQEHVLRAIYSMGRAKMLGLNEQLYAILESFTESKLIAPTSPAEIHLLFSGRILEYRFPSRRFDIHPTLKILLGLKDQKGKS